MLALRGGDLVGAARLLGAVDSALTAVQGTVEGEMRGFYARTRVEAIDALGDASFESESASGARWFLEQAVSIALKAASAGAAD